MTMSLSTGLISGMDTGALVSQLIAAEAAPQAALRTRLKAAELAASAYRTVNTTFLAVRAAAEAAVKPEVFTPVKATSSASTVSVSASSGARPGNLTFTVDQLATSHAVMNRNATPGTWTSATSLYGAAEIEVSDENGVAQPKITIGGTGTLTDAAAAINAATDLKLNASVVQLSSGEAALRVTSQETGLASKFSFTGAGTFTADTIGKDAQISIGTDTTVAITSATNTFDQVLPGATFTVSQQSTDKVTISVASNPDAVAAKMQSLVDAVNASLNEVRRATNNGKDSTATLKGDYSVTQLAGRLASAVTSAVVGAGSPPMTDLSPATVGFELSKDGKTVVFNKAKFLTALQSDPGLAQRMVAGRAAGTDSNGVAVPAVTGIAERLLAVATSASDSTTGSLVKLAEGRESTLKGIQDRIEAWDLRLAKRKETLTRQFTSMETSLSSLRNQSTWLAGQINSLPSGR